MNLDYDDLLDLIAVLDRAEPEDTEELDRIESLLARLNRELEKN